MYEQKRRLTELKRQPETAWLNGIHSQVLQEPVINPHRAFVNFFEKRAGYPRFKRKRRGPGSFTFPQSVKVEGNRVWLPQIGWVRFRKSREIEGTIKRATIRHRVSGWYLSLLCEIERPDPEPVLPTAETTVGVDLGLNDFAVLSTGERISQTGRKTRHGGRSGLKRESHVLQPWECHGRKSVVSCALINIEQEEKMKRKFINELLKSKPVPYYDKFTSRNR